MQPGGFTGLSNVDEAALEHWTTRLDQQVAGFDGDLVKFRRHLHAHPEPSGEEVATTRFIVDQLSRASLRPRILRDGLGAIADVTLGSPSLDSPLIAIRADIDALRIPDEKAVEYRSKNEGVAHACGHDAHATMTLGAALASARLVGDSALQGVRLRFLFQPAEETSQGAGWLIEQGALEGVDAILALHVDPERPAGEVGIRYGYLTAHCDEVEIVVSGHGGHAARPHHSFDPVAAAAHLIGSLYEFLPRAVDSRNPSVFTVGRIMGGYAPNVIPDHVEIQGTLRTTDNPTRQTLKRRLQEICEGAARASGTRVDLHFRHPLGGVVNDLRAAAALEQASRAIVGVEHTHLIDRPSMGGEDFSMYLEHVPGAMLRLGCAAPGARAPFLHSPLFDLDERALALGTRILLRAALLLALSPRPKSTP